MAGLVLGVDEAGRGPVLGPMVVAGVVLEEDELEALRKAGVRDSKKLTMAQREKMMAVLERLAYHVIVVVLPPELLDEFNLNDLEADTFSYVVSRACRAWGNLKRIAVDSVGPPEKLRKALSRHACGELVVEVEADEKYVEVSAASIVAKVVRDREIDGLRRRYGVRGSGYPTDPETIQWVKEEYARNPTRPPPFVRRTWKTLREIAPGWYVEKKQKRLLRRRKEVSLLDYLRGAGTSKS